MTCVCFSAGIVLHAPEFRPGENGLREPLRWNPEVIECRAGPVGRVHVDQLRGARHRELVLHAARKQEIEIVRQKQAARREIFDCGAVCDGLRELETGVVEDIRDAGRGVDALERGARVGEAFQAG